MEASFPGRGGSIGGLVPLDSHGVFQRWLVNLMFILKNLSLLGWHKDLSSHDYRLSR